MGSKGLQDTVSRELTKCEPGEEWKTLVQTLQHNNQGKQVKDDILAAFREHYPETIEDDQIHLFGSAVMGLAFQDSDLDFYVDLPNGDLPNVEPTRAAKTIRIEMIKKIIEASGKFTQVKVSTRPRVPIISCIHIGTLTKCDINGTNGFGALNSPIIAHLLKFDPRIHKLAIIIKYWMKIHRCSGKKHISNYAVVWMLLFYLQILPKPILPPIIEFQRNVPPVMCSYYNFAFDCSLQNKTENESDSHELLLGFFKFYRDFNYISQMICPLYGKILNKKDLREQEIPEMQSYKEILWVNRPQLLPMWLDNYALCIRDPFELVRKIPAEIEKDVHRNIVRKIGHAATIIECELQKGDAKSMFSQLFDVAEFDKFINTAAGLNELRKTEAEQKGYMSITCISSEAREMVTLKLMPTDFVLKMSKWTILTKDNAPIDEHSIRKSWAKEVIAMVLDILERIFNLDLVDHDDDDDDTDYDDFVRTFDLHGARDLFLDRDEQSIRATTWKDEVCFSRNRFNQTGTVLPLAVSATITADTKNFDYVSIEFSDKIKTSKRQNFFQTFWHDFVCRIDYFLQAYFAHRNDAANIVNRKLASAKETPTEPTDTPPIVQTLTKLQLKLYPTDVALIMARDIFCRTHQIPLTAFNGKEVNIRQFWAKEVIEMIAELLCDIFKLELRNVTSRTHQLTFDITKLCGNSIQMFLNRRLKRPIGPDLWSEEFQDSTDRFQPEALPSKVGFRLSATITADAENFNFVSVEFNDRFKAKKKNFYRTFCTEFVCRINYFVDIYFLHRNKITRQQLQTVTQILQP